MSTIKSLLDRTGRSIDKNSLKKIHGFTHATDSEMKSILEHAGLLSQEMSRACDVIHSACDICASTGRPATRKKVSLSHVNEAFNESVQADFLVVYIEGEKYEILNVVDCGTNYGERTILSMKDGKELSSRL